MSREHIDDFFPPHHEPAASAKNPSAPKVATPSPTQTPLSTESSPSARAQLPPHKWYLGIYEKKGPLRATCSGAHCVTKLQDGGLCVYVNGFWKAVGSGQKIPRLFYYCADGDCLSTRPKLSNLMIPPATITAEDTIPTATLEALRAEGLPIAQRS